MEGVDEGSDANLYVKGLPTYFTQAEVIGLFQEYGTVTSARHMPPPPGRTDATALVRMSSLDEANAAITALNGALVADAPAGPMQLSYHGGVRAQPSDNIYVKGLPSAITDESMRAIFADYGTVQSLRVMPPRPPATDCTALVRLSSVDEATAAIQALTGAMMPSSRQVQIVVRFANTPKSKEEQRRVQQQPAAPQFVPPPPTAFRSMPDHESWSSAGPSFILEVRYHGARNAPPSDNLYVKGLRPTITMDDLARIFGVFGKVVSVRVMPTATDATAMVRMASVEQASIAIAQLNGRAVEDGTPAGFSQASQYHGAAPPAVVVPPPQYVPNGGKGWGQPAAPRPSVSPSVVQAAAGPASRAPLFVRFHGAANAPPSDNLYVKGLPSNITQAEVAEVFQSCGMVLSVRVMPGMHDATALVRMSSVEEASLAVDVLHNAPLGHSNSNGFAMRREMAMRPPPPTRPPPPRAPPRPPPAGVVVPPPTALPPTMAHMPSAPYAEVSQQPAVAASGLLVRYHGARNAPPSDNLYVRGLPPGTTEDQVLGMFGAYGNVVSIRLMPGAADAAALVRMGSLEEAAMAVQFLGGAHNQGPSSMAAPRWSDGARAAPY